MSISRYVAETEAQHQFKLFAGHLESKVSNKQFSDYIRHYTYVILLLNIIIFCSSQELGGKLKEKTQNSEVT